MAKTSGVTRAPDVQRHRQQPNDLLSSLPSHHISNACLARLFLMTPTSDHPLRLMYPIRSSISSSIPSSGSASSRRRPFVHSPSYRIPALASSASAFACSSFTCSSPSRNGTAPGPRYDSGHVMCVVVSCFGYERRPTDHDELASGGKARKRFPAFPASCLDCDCANVWALVRQQGELGRDDRLAGQRHAQQDEQEAGTQSRRRGARGSLQAANRCLERGWLEPPQAVASLSRTSSSRVNNGSTSCSWVVLQVPGRSILKTAANTSEEHTQTLNFSAMETAVAAEGPPPPAPAPRAPSDNCSDDDDDEDEIALADDRRKSLARRVSFAPTAHVR